MSEKQAFKELLAACRQEDALAVRGAMIAWSATLFPDTPPRSLEQVSTSVCRRRTGSATRRPGFRAFRLHPNDLVRCRSGGRAPSSCAVEHKTKSHQPDSALALYPSPG